MGMQNWSIMTYKFLRIYASLPRRGISSRASHYACDPDSGLKDIVDGDDARVGRRFRSSRCAILERD